MNLLRIVLYLELTALATALPGLVPDNVLQPENTSNGYKNRFVDAYAPRLDGKKLFFMGVRPDWL